MTLSDRLRRSILLSFLVCTLALAGCLGPIERPMADFVWCPDGTEGRLDYWFTSTSSTIQGAVIDRFLWEFDDGSKPVESFWDVLHGFSEERAHRVTLTVTDSRGVSGTVTKDVPIAMAAFVHSTWQLTLGYPPTVAGIVENRFSERLDEVVVRAKFYDVDGVRLTDGRFAVTDLDPGEQALFEIGANEFKTRVFHATIEIESFSAECAFLWGAYPKEPD